jgi:hypothetical protein
MLMKTVLATAGLLAALVAGTGVAHAHPNIPKCHVGGGGELWCEDPETGESWEQEPGGTYNYTPSCSPYVHTVQCGG